MRALYAVQQHVALCGIECKTLLVIAGLFVTGLAAAQLRAEPLPYDEAFYAAADAPLAASDPSAPIHTASVTFAEEEPTADPDSARHVVSAHEPGGHPRDLGTSGDEDAALRMNLNAASARLLTQLPGIGPKKAAAVVAYRDEHGAFVSVDDLQRVRGIGPKTVAKLAPLLFVEPPVEAGAEIAAN